MGKTTTMCATLAVAALATLTGPLAGQEPVPVSLADFASLAWLDGRWVGSGGGYEAFHEEYRVVDDSTLVQRTFPDGEFGEPDGVSTMEYRNGVVRKLRNGQVESVVVALEDGRVEFRRVGGRGGFVWSRVSADEWRAVLETNRGEVVYTLRRLPDGG